MYFKVLCVHTTQMKKIMYIKVLCVHHTNGDKVYQGTVCTPHQWKIIYIKVLFA